MSNCYHPVIVQAGSSPSSIATTSSSPSSRMPSSTSSYTQTTSSGSNRSYISSTTDSSSRTAPPQLSRNATRPAQVAGEYPYGQQEFVYTGRPQGGNPNGGPKQHPEGYIRVSRGNVTVHNSGGQLKGSISVHLGQNSGNGPEHSWKCREMTEWSDNQGLCFCPTGRN